MSRHFRRFLVFTACLYCMLALEPMRFREKVLWTFWMTDEPDILHRCRGRQCVIQMSLEYLHSHWHRFDCLICITTNGTIVVSNFHLQLHGGTGTWAPWNGAYALIRMNYDIPSSHSTILITERSPNYQNTKQRHTDVIDVVIVTTNLCQ